MKHLIYPLRTAGLLLVALTYQPLRAQPIIEVCGVTEYCFCDDGMQEDPGVAFVLCPDTLWWNSVTVVFCSGAMPPNWVMRAYTGVDNMGTPIPALTGHFANLVNVQGQSTDSVIYIMVDRAVPTVSCAAGEVVPFRFLVFRSDLDPWPTSGDCAGTGPSCLSTGTIQYEPNTTDLISDASGRVRLPMATGAVDVVDAWGRVRHRARMTGSDAWLDLGVFGPGFYVVRSADGAHVWRAIVE